VEIAVILLQVVVLGIFVLLGCYIKVVLEMEMEQVVVLVEVATMVEEVVCLLEEEVEVVIQTY
jgi:hypothetical protein